MNESLGDFDEDIQREKTFAEERANEDIGDESPGGVGAFESYEDDQAEGDKQSRQGQSSSSSSSSSTASSSSQEQSSSSEDAGDVSGDQTSKSGEAVAAEEVGDPLPNIPDDIRKDDIVARQIREAAENESDPELREKLWEEYRKYKNL